MKILSISHEYPPVGGGGASACKNISKEICSKNNEVVIVTSSFNNLPKEEIDGRLKVLRINSLRKSEDHSTFIEMFSFLLSAMFRINRIINTEGPFDVIHIYFGIPAGPVGLYIKKRHKLPYIIRLGGGDIPGMQKRFDKMYKILGPAIHKIWKNSSCIVANSQGSLENARQFDASCNYQIINNGIDYNYFMPTQNKEQDDTFRILWVGRIIERKGLQHLVEALPSIIDACENKISVTLAGDGPYRQSIEDRAASLGINCINITGFIDREEVLSYYRKADVFVLPSHWEGMPNVVLEAMSCGLPIVMSNCQGSSELIDGNGFIIDMSHDPAIQISNCIKKLYFDQDIKAQMGQKSRQLILTKFSWEKTATQYLNLYEKAIKDNKVAL